MMPGMIMLWAGAIVDIPSGWHLCDGDAGTPDLRGKFVMCPDFEHAVGDEGGAKEHAHLWDSDYFRLDLISGDAVAAGSDYDDQTDFHILSDETDAEDGRPPYYVLCYIMKLS